MLQNMQSLALFGITYIVEGLVSEADSLQPSVDIRVRLFKATERDEDS